MPVQQESKGAAALTAAEVLRHALRYTPLQVEQKVKAAALSPLLAEIGDFGIGLLGPATRPATSTSTRSRWRRGRPPTTSSTSTTRGWLSSTGVPIGSSPAT